MTIYKDSDIREALRRKYIDTPKMSADFMTRMLQTTDEKKQHRNNKRRMWNVAIGTVAASILLILAFHFIGEKQPQQQLTKETVNTPARSNEHHLEKSALANMEKPVVVQQTIYPTLSDVKAVDKPSVQQKPKNSVLASDHKKQTNQRADMPESEKTDAERNLINHKPSDSNSQYENIAYYIARLEAEMDALDDSVNAEYMEELIAADVHLQQLVNRVVHGRVEQALIDSKQDSTVNYIYF